MGFFSQSTFNADCYSDYIALPQHLHACSESHTLAAVLLSGHRKILFTLEEMGCMALAVAVALLCMASQVSHKGLMKCYDKKVSQQTSVLCSDTGTRRDSIIFPVCSDTGTRRDSIIFPVCRLAKLI